MSLFIRVLLWPISALYGLVVRFRNHLYNIGYKKSFSYQSNIISVGNLSVGGNGKTPMVEYLIRLLGKNYQVATLSRGYGRNTKGFRMATPDDNAITIGDEPYQMLLKFAPQITVVVGEDRAMAIPKILLEKPEIQAIILDDAFQHRSVVPQFSILVTDYWFPFTGDSLLPGGRLREPRSGVARADVVVVTKCPPEIDLEQRKHITASIRKYKSGVPVFFSYIKYLNLVPISKEVTLTDETEVLLFSGIAKSESLVQHVSSNFNLRGFVEFKDHFRYSSKEIDTLSKRFSELTAVSKILLTTEKDMVRLLQFEDRIADLPIYYLPIECSFIRETDRFNETLLNSLSDVPNS